MKTFIYGMLFGVFATIFGLFAGLQISTTLGNILMFPVIAISALTGTPFGMMERQTVIISFIVALITWGLVFVLVKFLWRKFQERRRAL